jgi:hypothetical protein
MSRNALPGKLSISRRSSNVEDDYFVIEIEDGASGTTGAVARLSPAALALAISGVHAVSADVEWYTDRIGMRAEVKSENVPCNGYALTKAEKQAAVAPFEVDGWKADLEDVGNHHRRTANGYRVNFRRWVKRTTG